MRLVLEHQSHIQICQTAGVDTVSRKDVLPFADDAVGDGCGSIGVAFVSGVKHLYAVDIEDSVVIIAVSQIYVLAVEILGYFNLSAQPYLFSEPGSSGSRVFERTEAGSAFLPAPGIVVLGIPLAGRLAVSIVSFPRFFGGRRNQGSQLHFFHTHKTVRDTIHLECSDQRELCSGPVFYGAVIQIVVHTPGAGVGVDGNKGIGRCAEFVFLARGGGAGGNDGEDCQCCGKESVHNDSKKSIFRNCKCKAYYLNNKLFENTYIYGAK